MDSEPHRWHKYKSLHWQVCMFCGLVALRNDLTRWCIRNGCDYKDHPDYEKKTKELTK